MPGTSHEEGPDAYASPTVDFLVLAFLTFLLAWGTMAVLH